ncbi:ATP-binding protein [Leptospira noumeaensis]|uniref:ATP-binding protein n=1 Tax=Leptospira noumeaensis TaxID=2484964 RepID=A0A4V6QLF3_9LEPT|nr:ATP-binding protein [Leptospira noumeaensis]TGK82004.1 ATP-binding protein [Leptospira noumeaensis]
MNKEFDHIRNQTIGTVEFISPREIKVLLEINAPQSTAINTGVPQLFPKVNGFVLIPNESGSLVGIISWVGIEHSPYPKRKGYKDFDLIDLPFPLRKLSISPLGVLKEANGNYEIERGVYSYPSVGDIVVVPNQAQLRAIVQNKDSYAKVKIGISSMAANAPVYINPDRVFGRHIAVLGNTGSGKSCSVAGLIRWSLEAAQKELKEGKKLNSRFIVLDPNGEYTNTFDGLCNVRKFQVILTKKTGENLNVNQLKVPSWLWNSYEWSSIAQASGKTQRPLLRKTLREVRYGGRLDENDSLIKPKRFITSLLVSLRNFERLGIDTIAGFPGKQNLGELLQASINSLNILSASLKKPQKTKIQSIITSINTILGRRQKNNAGYFPAFDLADLNEIVNTILDTQTVFGELKTYQGPDEDSPVFFTNEDFLSHVERLSQENNVQQYMDFFIMRVRSIITDSRIASVIETKTKEEPTLEQWLSEYIGSDDDNGSINIIDLSLLPSEILFVIVSVLSRVIFEGHQRYRRMTGNILPTTLVVEEAHNFIKRYEGDSDEITANKLCSQSFEKIAKEGRKFGLGLMLSSQRPSELSQTVLSQCNSFLLHRLVNDKDQEMVKKLVPDNLGSILNELPILPTKKAILLGWAAPIPIIVEMNTLADKDRPKSNDPEFWDVWTGSKEQKLNWKEIADEWQKEENS